MLDIYSLTWQSSAHDRYETDMVDRCARFLEDRVDVTVLEVFGHLDVTAEVANNGFTVRCAPDDVGVLVEGLAAIVGAPVGRFRFPETPTY